nr:pectin acetylesterase 8-like [Ipomoea batatas]
MERTNILVCLFFMFICMNIKINSACMIGPTPNVSITRLINDKGALCLDGTPPAYYLDQGDGDGINNWVIYLQGGGWCSTVEECVDRSQRYFGSSKNLNESVQFVNILSKDSKTNPDFCSWNRVFIHYCDGSSYTGDVDTIDPATNITYRGGRIFNLVMEDLLKRGMKNAKNAILSGSSAGGLAVILHCDRFQSFLPTGVKVKCFSNSAYFLHELSIAYLLNTRYVSCIKIAPWLRRMKLKAYPEVFGDWFYDRRAINIIDISNVSKNCTDSGIQILPIRQ